MPPQTPHTLPTPQPSTLTLDAESDKSFWHGYTGFYAQALPVEVSGLVIEFGVFNGNSIRWLLQRYPQARIVGADIVPPQPQWPVHARVEYAQLDQASDAQVQALLQRLPPAELIIEDGSHMPSHQWRCLWMGLDRLAPGGTYVLEDIHTSHSAHAQYRQEAGGGLSDRLGAALGRPARSMTTALSVLLALEQQRRLGADRPVPESLLAGLGEGFIRPEQVQRLHTQLDSIQVYRRANLPLRCFRCGSEAFDYAALRCVCGEPVYAEADSMSIVMRKKA